MNKKICFNKTIVFIGIVVILLLGVVTLSNYIKNQKYSTNSRASAAPKTLKQSPAPKEGILGSSCTVINSENTCNEGLTCRENDKTCQIISARDYEEQQWEKQKIQLKGKSSIDALPTGYLSYSEIVSELQSITNAHPTLTKLDSIGFSIDRKDIYSLKITNENIEEGRRNSKPPFLVTALYHGNEIAGTEVSMEWIRYLLNNYENDPEVAFLVNYRKLYIVPMVNVDKYGIDRNNSNGVNLNRNHSFQWQGEGSAPASEPEIIGLQKFYNQVFTKFRGDNSGENNNLSMPASLDTQGLFITIHSNWHSGGWLWFWGWNDAPLENENGPQAYQIGSRLSNASGYPLLAPGTGQAGTAPGCAEDYIYGYFGVPGYTPELKNSNQSPPIDHVKNVNWNIEMRPAFLLAAALAAQPYLLSYGPRVNNGNASSIATLTSRVDVSATAIDADKNSSNFAEFYIIPPELGGKPIVSGPVTNGTISLSAPGSAFSKGKNVLSVRFRNTSNQWGSMKGIAFVEGTGKESIYITSPTPNSKLGGMDVTSVIFTIIAQDSVPFESLQTQMCFFDGFGMKNCHDWKPANKKDGFSWEITENIPSQESNSRSLTLTVHIVNGTSPDATFLYGVNYPLNRVFIPLVSH